MKFDPEKIIFFKVELWMVFLLGLFGLAGTVLFGWSVLKTEQGVTESTWYSPLAHHIAQTPRYARMAWNKGLTFDESGNLVFADSHPFVLENKLGFTGLKIEDPGFQDRGYLLVSAYSDERNSTMVYLYSLGEKKKIWEWIPNHEEIVEKTPRLKKLQATGERLLQNERKIFTSVNPYLTEDGHLVAATWHGVLVKLDPQSNVVWTVDGHFHHSINRDTEGNFVIPSVQTHGEETFFCDDTYVIVSPKGRIIEERSVLKILEDNGYGDLAWGIQSWVAQTRDPNMPLPQRLPDPIHLNDVYPILADDNWAKKGDLLLSCRNLGTVLQYRPSTGKIIRLQRGPWLNQHDVNYLGEGKISVFDNQAVRGKFDYDPKFSKIYHDGKPYSQPVIFNFDSGEVSRPYDRVFAQHELFTQIQGTQQILENGDVFVDMYGENQLMRVSQDGIRWRYAHGLSEPNTISMLFWCRYLPKDTDLSWIPQGKSLAADSPAP
ncbi:MAG: arylsulfotransferase family protein [Verrucomicrobiota bacterium]